jgi:hypothetical protein
VFPNRVGQVLSYLEKVQKVSTDTGTGTQ